MAKDTPAVSDAAERIVDRSLWAVAAALCFALVQKFGSLHVPPPEALDDAWQLAMQFAWLNGLQFGHDIVFPHGPYGGFYGQVYNPDLIGLLYLINLPYALLLAICVVWTLRVRAGSGVLRSMLASALAILTAAAITLGSDGIWMLPSFLLMGLALDDRKTPAALLVMLILVIALGALAKLSFLMMGLTALIAWTAAAAARRDRLAPAALPLFAAAVAGLWLAAGQSPGGFVDWVGVSLQVASGYAAAMSLTSDWSDLAVFAALAACLLSGLWIEFRRETRGFVKLVVMLGWVGLFLLVAKAGFVRHDGHGVFPFQMLAATGAMVVARLLPVARRKVRAVTIQAIALVAAVGWLCDAQVRLTPGAPGVGERIASRFLDLPADLADILNDLLSKRGKAALFSDMATESRRLLGGPHPRIAAATSVDVYPFKSAPPIIAGLPYHPRPIVQSYQAYTRVLAQHDVDHIRRNGAEIYVVHVGSIDNRPTFADGGYLWPEFLSLYDPVDQVPLGLVLERRSIPVTLDSRTVFEGTSAYNTRIDLPATAPGTILQVQGTIRPTILGRVFGLVFKPPQLTVTLRRADGGEQVHRLVPGQLGAGFPISPILHDPEEVQALFDGRQAGSAVTEFRINAAGFQRLFWANGFPLTVTQIHRPGQD